MALQLNKGRSLVSWKLAGAFFAILALMLQPLVTLNVPAAFASAMSVGINEVMPDPVAISDANGEWVELKNNGDTTVDISGWTVDGATISAGKSIVAGGLFVLCATAEATTECDDVNPSLALTNGGETLILQNTASDVIDEFAYVGSTAGQSIEVVKENGTTTGVDNSTDGYDTNQTPAQSGNTGTPGAANRVLPAATAVTNTQTGETYDTLQLAVSDASSGDTLTVNENLTLGSQVTINTSLTINGNGHSLSPTFAKTDNDNNSAIGIIGTSGVIINNLMIEGNGGTALHGVNVYESGSVTLSSLTITNNDNYAVVINGSSVTVNSITTSGNGWGGINVDQASSSLTINGLNSQSEFVALYVEEGAFTDNSGQYSELIPGVGLYQPTLTPYTYSADDSNFVGSPKYVRENNFGSDISAQVRVPDSATNVRFSVNGTVVTDADSMNEAKDDDIYKVNGAAAGSQWWRVQKALPSGEYNVAAEYLINSTWHPVTGQGIVHSIDAPWAEYVVPQADQYFRPNDRVVRVKADDQFNQFSRMVTVINGVSHEVLREDCSDQGSYVLCDLANLGLPENTYVANTTTYTKANNRVDDLVSSPFSIDGTAPSVRTAEIISPLGVSIYTDSIELRHRVKESNSLKGLEFYFTKPRADGACDPNMPKALGPIDAQLTNHNTVNQIWLHRTTVDTGSLNGTYCIFSVAEDSAMNHSDPQEKKFSITFDNQGPALSVDNPANGEALTNRSTPIEVNGSVSDEYGVDRVVMFLEGRYIDGYDTRRVASTFSTANGGNYGFTLPEDVIADGTYSLIVNAYDNQNNPTTVRRTITVDSTAPTLSNLAAVQNTDSTYTLSVTTDGTASSVVFTLDGGSPVAGVLNSDGVTWSVVTGVLNAETSHTFFAKSIDAVGNQSSSTSYGFTVPPVSGSVPDPDNDPLVTLSNFGANPNGNASLNGNANPAQAGAGDVLGAQDDDEDDVLGANATDDVAALSPSAEGWKIMGIAWYWWLLALAALAAAGWWFIAGRRRTAEEF